MSDLLQSLSAGFSQIVATAAPGVVAVHSHRSRANGFIWRPGLVVTSDESLAEDGEVTVVLAGGDSVAATIVGRDATTAVALLRIEGAGQPVALTPDPVAVGTLALVVGGQGGSPSASLAMVALSGPAWRSMRGGEIDARIELDVALRRSGEGALVLGPHGAGIGMTVFGPRRRVLVIPTATIERVAARLLAHGRVSRGYLGLGLQPVRLPDGGMGAMVMSVDAKGPASAADVRQGDVITGWNGHPIRHIRAMLNELGPDSVGSVVRLAVRRAGAPIEVSLTIGERPSV